MKRTIIWTPKPEPEVIPEPVAVAILESPQVETTESPPARNTMNRAPANGHMSLKKRELFEPEKSLIKNVLFLPNNGIIKPDLCVAFKRQHMPVEVTIFQVTGYVTTLHGQVARGIIRLRDQRTYEANIKARRKLWGTYNTPRYIAMREKAEAQPPQRPRMIEPQYEIVPSRRKVA